MSTLLLSVVAVDEDSGADGLVTYTIQGNQQVLDTFSIHSETGLIELSGTLNLTRTSLYQIEVVATDGGFTQRLGSARVDVVIHEDNVQRPVFEEEYYKAKVKENAPAYTSVLHVEAVDGDEGKVILVSIVTSLTVCSDFTEFPVISILFARNKCVLIC